MAFGQTSCQIDCAATAPAAASAAAAVTFAATATASGCASAPSYEWDFGDGSPRATGASVTHAYAAPGVYSWRVTAGAGSGVTTIDTIAGGYGEAIDARQAPFTTPVSIARDPLGRGVYVYDQSIGGGFLRFINTSATPVVIAGRTIQPGTSRVLEDADSPLGSISILSGVAATSLALSSDGNVLFIGDANEGAIYAFNVSASAQTVLGTGVPPRRVLRLIASLGPISGVATHPQTGQIYCSAFNVVRRLTAIDQSVIVAGNGAPSAADTPFPAGVVSALNVPLLVPRDHPLCQSRRGRGDALRGHARGADSRSGPDRHDQPRRRRGRERQHAGQHGELRHAAGDFYHRPGRLRY